MTSFDQIVIAPPGRFDGIERPYSPEDVIRLRGSVPIDHSLARRGALKLWELLKREEPVRALGAATLCHRQPSRRRRRYGGGSFTRRLSPR